MIHGVLHEDGTLTDIRRYAADEMDTPGLVPVRNHPRHHGPTGYNAETQEPTKLPVPLSHLGALTLAVDRLTRGLPVPLPALQVIRKNVMDA